MSDTTPESKTTALTVKTEFTGTLDMSLDEFRKINPDADIATSTFTIDVREEDGTLHTFSGVPIEMARGGVRFRCDLAWIVTRKRTACAEKTDGTRPYGRHD